MFSFSELLSEERAQGEWSSLYMLIVLIIAALVLVSVVKPMFRQSQKIVTQKVADAKQGA
ncbi:MAG: hypothetical protein HY394_01540 [Candidatus Diapherotrites archaeon]|nr:hypothetical protein [Candidatus Diapherotrites archaeon]